MYKASITTNDNIFVMETLSSMAQTASNAIFGAQDQNKQEPISGVRGDTAHGEPYDAGNMGK